MRAEHISSLEEAELAALLLVGDLVDADVGKVVAHRHLGVRLVSVGRSNNTFITFMFVGKVEMTLALETIK